MQTVARMYDSDRDDELIAIVAQDDNGALFVKGPAARKWKQVHPSLNPTLDAYLANCEGNFGWRTERIV